MDKTWKEVKWNLQETPDFVLKNQLCTWNSLSLFLFLLCDKRLHEGKMQLHGLEIFFSAHKAGLLWRSGLHIIPESL